MLLKKKDLLIMIEALSAEIITLKSRVSELEVQNTQNINFNIDSKEVAKINMASTEPLLSFNSKGINVKGGIINGTK